MKFIKFQKMILGAALLLPACSFSDDTLWPSLAGEEAKPQAQQQAAAPATPQPASTASAGAGGAQLGTSSFEPSGVTPGQPTGTFVGKKVVELREELTRLQDSVSAHNQSLQSLRANMIASSQQYHTAVGAINSRLQVGTTPGNPILVQQFNQAQSDLDKISSDIAAMNQLATAVTGDSTMSQFLAESARSAFTVSGAVDEDHRQLEILQDEVDQTVVLVDRLLKELSEDVRRQTNYVATERSNLNLLSAGIKTGEIYGASLVNKAMASAAGSNLASGPMKASDTTGRRPLVVIRFDRKDVNYQQALYSAVSRVLERRPNASFDLVAVAPNAGGPAMVALNSNKSRRFAEGVLRSLVEMGLPPGRVAVSGKTSAQASANEVHLYLR